MSSNKGSAVVRLLTAIVVWWKELRQAYSYETYFAHLDGYTYTLLHFVWEFFIQLYCLRFVCRVRGHDIVNDGWAGPESGGEDMHCTRCDWSFHHIYY